ncbi:MULTISPECIES: TRAP transporter substrate-binding protein [unclassified Paenibacillus]|uniref:TRAP transporter substrate-binding protein n=1 Tax=unclassified Paenibacillus TaxID=185978 RepID=UPI001AE31184|nr:MULTISPECIES: TRAP transporter substrate-binding protein [unclassified Paenibacillus]MBP1154078.1 tripartite ATP-independent transporter DctP family solute receptor [Paenibacillus sp. PvP091]MBP1170537.1 tripartite ATP-independent transporter DctP family solute receptor [Paenibacillus sp. PvR098]MBP2441565.1 tripartite ATP-independent transporter DctP family solute receptor [Paenibacillus sp. PvP052]
MKKKLTLALVSILSLSAILTACGGEPQDKGTSEGQGGKTYTFKLAHTTQPTHVWHKTAEKFNEELNARSNGRMQVSLYPASQLGPDKDLMQQLETGSLDFGIIAGGYVGTRSEAFNAWFMPLLFKNLDTAVDARNSEPAKKILAELSKQGLVGMDYVFAGDRHILMKNAAVTKAEDMVGKKIRVSASLVVQDFWKAVGAAPTPMPLSEVYTALQTGVIDGVDIDLDALMTEKYYELAKNLTLTNHMVYPGIVMMNKGIFEAIPQEDQKIITEAMKAAVEWGNKEQIALEHKHLEDLKTKGATVTELTNVDSFKKISEELYAKYSKNELIKEFIQANQK